MKKTYEKAIVKLGDLCLKREANSICFLTILYQPKVSKEMNEKLKKFKRQND